jgi:AcrR family transcriptional regulator
LRRRSQSTLEPRKSPVQARSTASVDALLEATIQVLRNAGKEGLTTTKVAMRAGVSVGTLYQYFPNKRALLQAALRRHLSEIAEAVELACKQQKGATHRQMLDALFTTFLHAKMKDTRTSVALYSVSSDVDGVKIAREMGVRFHRAITQMLASSSEAPTSDPQIAAFVLQAAMVGVSRSLLESGDPRERFEAVRRELIKLGSAYLSASQVSTRDSIVST